LYTRSAAALKHWLHIRPRNAITVLDTHDGIGVADVDAARGNDGLQGLLTPDEIDTLVKTTHHRSRGESRIASGSAASNVDASQINCTFYDALGRRDSEYLVARAIQCFVPGIPQVYYVGLLAGCNDVDLLSRTGVGRDINRHYFTADELRVALSQPVVQSLLALLQIRNTHPAFQGTFDTRDSAVDRIALVWTNGDAFARLDVDFTAMCASITCSSSAQSTSRVAWHTLAEARA
jgi:sucrose phosphorylase